MVEAVRVAAHEVVLLAACRETDPWQLAGGPAAVLAAAPRTDDSLAGWVAALTTGLRGAAPDAVVLQGATTPCLAAALAAAEQGLAVVRLGAGVRRHGATRAHDRAERLVDQACSAWCAPSREQELNLLREGFPAAGIRLVGSTLPTPGGARTRPGTGALLLLTGPDHVRLLAACEQAARTLGLAVAHARPDASFSQRLDAVEAARVLFTDDAGAMEEGHLLGVPVVAVGDGCARPDLLDTGRAACAGHEPAALARAAEVLLARPATVAPPTAPPTAPAAVLAAVLDLLARTTGSATTAAAPVPAAPTLPSDGDASGRTLGAEEVELVSRAIRSGTLNSTRGTMVTRLEREFAAAMGRKHAIACASGSAAVHCAIAALGLRAGDEVVTTPITDMGAITPILYEGGVPVFADVDPRTINVTAETVARVLTDRTRAIVVTPLFGMPVDLQPILELACRRGLWVVEDMAQAFLCEEKAGRPGTRGMIATWSLQQGKHMTTGEGGMVTTDDADVARRVTLFVNKAWGYGDPKPDHVFPAPNYRMTELQGAVALAQLRKLEWVVQRRREVAAAISAALADVRGLVLPRDPEGGRHSWWKYAFFVDASSIQGGAVALGKRMRDRGVFCVPRYIQKPAFECQLFQDWSASPVSWMPLQHNPRRDQPQPLFHRKDYPGAVAALESVIVLPVNELYTRDHVAHVAEVIRSEAEALRNG